jgi:hypothetical protein
LIALLLLFYVIFDLKVEYSISFGLCDHGDIWLMNICGIGRAVNPISNLPNAYISKEPGEAQKELGIEKEASYIISVINPKKPAVAIDSFCLVLMLRQSSLMDKEWWNKIWCNELGLSSAPDEKTLLMMRNGFSQFYVIGFFHSLFFRHRERILDIS